MPVSDRPGGIADVTRRLAEAGASVKDIFHERAWLQSSVDQVIIKAVLETRGPKHNIERAPPPAEPQGPIASPHAAPMLAVARVQCWTH